MRNKTHKYLLILTIGALMFTLSCERPDPDPSVKPKKEDTRAEGAKYVFDQNSFPEVHITAKLADWNAFLKVFDKNPSTKKCMVCSVDYVKNGETTHIDSVGFRLRGRSSRQRPEGWQGQSHKATDTDWHHFHFGLNFNKYIDGAEHSLKGQRKLWFKWPHEDPTYMREHYSFDLFQRYGIWTAPRVVFCKVFLQVEGDAKEAYLGVYNIIEPIDGNFVKMNAENFGGKDGFLWKCSLGAQLTSAGGQSYGYERDGDENDYTYELKTNVENYEAAMNQLRGFISSINSLSGTDFSRFIAAHCDVEHLMKMYAVNVTLGMWDDYWGNANNFFLYFNTQDPENYKVYMLPYDYDNSLGTTFPYYVKDSGTHSPLDWGPKTRPLIYKILQNDYFKQYYLDAMEELIDPSKDYFHVSKSLPRLQAWRDRITPLVSNDTGEDMTIRDKPASWSGIKTYRIFEQGKNNFFEVRTAAIEKVLKQQ